MSSLYPDLPAARWRAMTRDGLVVLLLIAFAILGIRVHHSVDRLAALGAGLVQAGSTVKTALGSAASSISGVPVVGGDLAGALRGAGSATGGGVVSLGRSGEQDAHHLATLLGVLMWAIPSAVLLASVLPRRVAEVRRLRHLRLALSAPNAEARRRLLALRAVMSLPDEALFAYSPDPAGDLLAGRYEALATAALSQAGLRGADQGRASAPRSWS
jgi:hypothetical protein